MAEREQKDDENLSSGESREDMLQRALDELVTFPRLRLISAGPDEYKVKLGEREYVISKNDMSEFISDGAADITTGIRLELTQTINLKTGIFLDEDVAKEFMEVMIFHEIREKEYAEAGFDDAHERAVHDEILYVLKHLDPEEQKKYFSFAETYRAQKKQKEEAKAGREKEEEEKREKELELEGGKREERFAEDKAQREAERDRVQNEIREREIERKGRVEKFWESHPELEDYLTKAVERFKQLSPGLKYVLYLRRLKVDANYGALSLWDRDKLEWKSEVEKLIQEIYGAAATRKDKSVIAYFEGYRPKELRHDKYYNREWKVYREHLEAFVESGRYLKFDPEKLEPTTEPLTDLDKEHLQTILDLYDEVEKRGKEKKLTPEFLDEIRMKSDALCRGRLDKPYV